ncbi:hypothetical protein KKG48_00825 [Patescibacteria group bacterium]|nr:hypothetical protein [Patescibacteria group bacterium]MCG2694685.1 hypothetical protein [Candidatus Parcubacteria bacterium]
MVENKILKWSLVLGIIIVLNLFFAYAMKVIYKAPQYEDFCQKEQVIEKINTKEACLEKGGQWNENIIDRGLVTGEVSVQVPGYCNLNFVCNNEFIDAQENYEKNVFMTLIGLGVLSIIIGFMIASTEVVSMGLSLGGVLSFIVASIRYWQYASEYLQVIILGLALVVLIWLGVKKFK